MVDIETEIAAVFCQLGSTVTCFDEARTARSRERAGERTNYVFVSILMGRMECRSALVDACLLQCQGELTVIAMSPLVFLFAGAPLCGLLLPGLFVLPVSAKNRGEVIGRKVENGGILSVATEEREMPCCCLCR